MSMTDAKSWKLLAMCVVCTALTTHITARGDSMTAEQALADYHRQVAARFDSRLSALLSSADLERTAEVVREKLALIDQLVEELLQGLDDMTQTAFANALDEVHGAPRPTPQSPKTAQPISVTADEIFNTYEPQLGTSLLSESGVETQFAALVHNKLAATSEYLRQILHSLKPVNDQQAVDLVERCLVLPMMMTDDLAWSDVNVSALPEWMSHPQYLRVMENFAVRVGRPHTAYAFYVRRVAPGDEKARGKLSYPKFVIQCVDALEKNGQYQMATACLHKGIQWVEAKGQHDSTVELRLKLASTVNAMGHPQLAAEQLAVILKNPLTSTWRAQAAALRLMYLYRSEQIEDALKESRVYISDPECESALPNLMYVEWLAQRSAGKVEAAARTRAQFLKKFPYHPLAPDIHLAKAVDAMTGNDFQEAKRVLEYIQERFPSYAGMGKVRALHKGVSAISKGG